MNQAARKYEEAPRFTHRLDITRCLVHDIVTSRHIKTAETSNRSESRCISFQSSPD